MHRWLFDQIHRRNLVYNQCWEDPSIDQDALRIGRYDRIVTLTSAGCNALDYLLRAPQVIECVDVNPHQTALLELKLAALRQLSFESFFAMFGAGRITGHREIYCRELRPQLSSASRAIWDRRIDYFHPDGKGLYFHGTSGWFARLLNRYIDLRSSLRRDLEQFIETDSLAAQSQFYRARIAPRLWSSPVRFLLRRPEVLSMLGVPPEQIHAMRRSGFTDLSSIIEQRIERMFTAVPIRFNYFWRVYIQGSYTRECCPNYLKAWNFERLRRLSERLRLHTMTLTEFLRLAQGPYSVFVLLDHMDWLTSRPELLREEWSWILRRAVRGARIIYRSGGASFDDIPESALPYLRFERPFNYEDMYRRDRVGTYGSFYLARVTA